MLGTILGDIIGSPYEFDVNNIKTKDFPLFSDKSKFTDDTVVSLAVSEGLINGYHNRDKTEIEIIKSMHTLCNEYSSVGYGSKFSEWLSTDNPEPYNSCGNGSAMRVSPVAWIYNNINDIECFAEISAKVTHNHPEGIKGAKAVAVAIFLARKGKDKNYIKTYIENMYGYDLSRSCNCIRLNYHHVETCQETVPEAITAFLEGSNFEDVIRLSISLGGDSDTIAAISGSIAEAYYEIPYELSTKVIAMLPRELKDILYQYDLFIAH